MILVTRYAMDTIITGLGEGLQYDFKRTHRQLKLKVHLLEIYRSKWKERNSIFNDARFYIINIETVGSCLSSRKTIQYSDLHLHLHLHVSIVTQENGPQ